MITHPWRSGRDGFDESLHIAQRRQSDAAEKIESNGMGFAMWTLSDLLGYSISTSPEISMMNARRGYYTSPGKTYLHRGDHDGFDESVHNGMQRQADGGVN